MNFLKLFFITIILTLLCACTIKKPIKQISYIKITPNEYNTKTFSGIIKSANSTKLSFQSEGKITYLPFTKGDFVKKGQAIAKLDGILYEIKKNEEQARLKEATVQYDKQKSYYNRMDTLHKAGAISENDWESARYELEVIKQKIKIQKEKIKYINKEISYNAIYAPFDGYIEEKFLDEGSYATIAKPIISFISSNGLIVETMLDETLINKVKINEEVKINVLDETLKGKISHISKSSLNSGGYLVKISLNENNSKAKEGMSAKVELNLKDYKNIKIPLESIFEKENKQYVFKIKNIKNNIGELIKTEIITGNIENNEVEVLSGIKENDLILINNLEDYKDKDKVKL